MRVAVDIGGTFTDVVVFDEAKSDLSLAKTLSTPAELARGVLDGLTKAAVRFEEMTTLIHGSTIVVNAIIERRGAKTALVTTKGFRKLVQIGNYVQMPLGGLTTMQSTMRNRPDEAKRVIRSLQQAQKAMIESPEKSLELISQSLKVDRAIAEETFKLYRETTSANTGIPTRAGMGRIVEAIQMLGQFTDRKIAFEEIADDGIAREVARELGYKLP